MQEAVLKQINELKALKVKLFSRLDKKYAAGEVSRSLKVSLTYETQMVYDRYMRRVSRRVPNDEVRILQNGNMLKAELQKIDEATKTKPKPNSKVINPPQSKTYYVWYVEGSQKPGLPDNFNVSAQNLLKKIFSF